MSGIKPITNFPTILPKYDFFGGCDPTNAFFEIFKTKNCQKRRVI
jgi:hypothetical protein